MLNRWQRSKTTAVNTAFSLEKLNMQRKSAALTKNCRYNKSIFVSDGSQYPMLSYFNMPACKSWHLSDFSLHTLVLPAGGGKGKGQQLPLAGCSCSNSQKLVYHSLSQVPVCSGILLQAFLDTVTGTRDTGGGLCSLHSITSSSERQLRDKLRNNELVHRHDP